jgi:hypothetical protein
VISLFIVDEAVTDETALDDAGGVSVLVVVAQEDRRTMPNASAKQRKQVRIMINSNLGFEKASRD